MDSGMTLTGMHLISKKALGSELHSAGGTKMRTAGSHRISGRRLTVNGTSSMP